MKINIYFVDNNKGHTAKEPHSLKATQLKGNIA